MRIIVYIQSFDRYLHACSLHRRLWGLTDWLFCDILYWLSHFLPKLSNPFQFTFWSMTNLHKNCDNWDWLCHLLSNRMRFGLPQGGGDELCFCIQTCLKDVVPAGLLRAGVSGLHLGFRMPATSPSGLPTLPSLGREMPDVLVDFSRSWRDKQLGEECVWCCRQYSYCSVLPLWGSQNMSSGTESQHNWTLLSELSLYGSTSCDDS